MGTRAMVPVALALAVGGCGKPTGVYVGSMTVTHAHGAAGEQTHEATSDPQARVQITATQGEAVFDLTLPTCSMTARWDEGARTLTVEPGARCSCGTSVDRSPAEVTGIAKLPTRGRLEFDLSADNDDGSTCHWNFSGKLE